MRTGGQQLKGEVLERERRPVEKLEHIQVRTELLQGCDVRVIEAAVAPCDERMQRFGPDVGREHAQKFEAQLRIRPAWPVLRQSAARKFGALN